jgi:lipopolysaccharide cholinephosphotransferase
LKFKGTQWNRRQKGKLSLQSAVARVVCFQRGMGFSYPNNIAIYAGRLPQIKSAEMMILREIDMLCRKHGINYFLAGGTLLGAVRNGASIPWDDDFDIGFLRKDFDRFREVCDKELGDRFVHTCYYNETKSHYIVDKIRLRDTYFSTRYSSIHAVEDGIFIDCLVYDATFKNKLFAKIHDKVCACFGKLVQAYWREYRRDEKIATWKWLIIKAAEVFPIDFWHKLYSFAISLCRHTKAPSFLIDSMGKHIGLGTIPFDGLESVKRVSFDDGFSAPVPANPTGYLIYDYGDGYLAPPPYCKQIAPHNFARIDLGKYLYVEDGDVSFRNVDLRGELFEKEITHG